MTTSECSTSAASTASWNSLPLELHAMIVNRMDPLSCNTLAKCGSLEHAVVRKYAKFNINLYVRRVGLDKILIKMTLEGTKEEVYSRWEITTTRKRKSETILKDSEGKILYTRKTGKLYTTAFGIIGQMSNDPMFTLKTLSLKLGHYKGKLNFGKKTVNMDTLTLERCMCKRTIVGIMKNYQWDARYIRAVYRDADAEIPQFIKKILPQREKMKNAEMMIDLTKMKAKLEKQKNWINKYQEFNGQISAHRLTPEEKELLKEFGEMLV